MSTEFLDITIESESAVVQAYGASDMLTNGSFEDGLSNVYAASGSGLSIGNAGVWEYAYSPTVRTEHIHIYDGYTSLEWYNAPPVSQTPWLRQVIAVTPEMLGQTIHYSGYIKSSSSLGSTASFGFWTAGLADEDNSPDGYGDSMEGAYLHSATGRVRLDYDNSDWFFFHVYFRIPVDSEITHIGPIIRPISDNSSEDIVYLDGIRMFAEPKYRSESWRIDVEPIDNLIYGYGYGVAFRTDNLTPEDYFDYFNIIGVDGTTEGFGIASSTVSSDLPDDLVDLGYSYAFGYEKTPGFLSDDSDYVQVRATVYENNVRQPGIRVTFKASPGVVLDPSSGETDTNGEIITTVRMSEETLQFTSRDAGASLRSFVPLNGILRIEAEIDRNPRENEALSLIKTQATQLISTDVTFTLDIGSYAYQNRYATAFGFEGGYGY